MSDTPPHLVARLPCRVTIIIEDPNDKTVRTTKIPLALGAHIEVDEESDEYFDLDPYGRGPELLFAPARRRNPEIALNLRALRDDVTGITHWLQVVDMSPETLKELGVG